MIRTGEQHDFFDYSPIIHRPSWRWPNGSRVAVWIVPNIEHYEIRDSRGRMDVPTFSRIDYGNRVGLWRLMDALDRRGIKGTVALNASVCRHYPQIIDECRRRDWELMGHGITNSEHLNDLSPAEARTVVEQTVEIIRSATNQPARGWLGPGLIEVDGTLDALAECGVEYVCDWTNDDQPYRMRKGLYSIPYTSDFNDVPAFRLRGATPAEYCQFICDGFDVLYREGETSARVLCLALHPGLIGAPHRIGYLEKALDYIGQHPGVWWARGMDIIDAYRVIERDQNH